MMARAAAKRVTKAPDRPSDNWMEGMDWSADGAPLVVLTKDPRLTTNDGSMDWSADGAPLVILEKL